MPYHATWAVLLKRAALAHVMGQHDATKRNYIHPFDRQRTDDGTLWIRVFY